nr:hypothetical protein Iba_scaffold78090CG0010 [Ipomoea batatas]
MINLLFVILELRLGCHTTKTLKKRMKAVNKEMRKTSCSQGIRRIQVC